MRRLGPGRLGVFALPSRSHSSLGETGVKAVFSFMERDRDQGIFSLVEIKACIAGHPSSCGLCSVPTTEVGCA